MKGFSNEPLSQEQGVSLASPFLPGTMSPCSPLGRLYPPRTWQSYSSTSCPSPTFTDLLLFPRMGAIAPHIPMLPQATDGHPVSAMTRGSPCPQPHLHPSTLAPAATSFSSPRGASALTTPTASVCDPLRPLSSCRRFSPHLLPAWGTLAAFPPTLSRSMASFKSPGLRPSLETLQEPRRLLWPPSPVEGLAYKAHTTKLKHVSSCSASLSLYISPLAALCPGRPP